MATPDTRAQAPASSTVQLLLTPLRAAVPAEGGALEVRQLLLQGKDREAKALLQRAGKQVAGYPLAGSQAGTAHDSDRAGPGDGGQGNVPCLSG